MTTSEWAAASFAGAREAAARDVAAATPQQRWDWLNDALMLALASGAIANERRERQRASEWE